MAGKPPILKVKCGSLKAAVWENEYKAEDGSTKKMYSVTPTHSYKKSDGTWQESTSFAMRDVPSLCAMLMQIFADNEIKEQGGSGY